jgi:hypothetical protein
VLVICSLQVPLLLHEPSCHLCVGSGLSALLRALLLSHMPRSHLCVDSGLSTLFIRVLHAIPCCMSPVPTSVWVLDSVLYLCVYYGPCYCCTSPYPTSVWFLGSVHYLFVFYGHYLLLHKPRPHLCMVSGLSALFICVIQAISCRMSPDPTSAWFLGSAYCLFVFYGSYLLLRKPRPQFCMSCGLSALIICALWALSYLLLHEPRSHLCVVSGLSALFICALWVLTAAAQAQIPPLSGFLAWYIISLYLLVLNYTAHN